MKNFPHGPQDLIKEAYRVLKKDGIILMMVTADNFLSRFIDDSNNFLNRLGSQWGIIFRYLCCLKYFRKTPWGTDNHLLFVGRKSYLLKLEIFRKITEFKLPSAFLKIGLSLRQHVLTVLELIQGRQVER